MADKLGISPIGESIVLWETSYHAGKAAGATEVIVESGTKYFKKGNYLVFLLSPAKIAYGSGHASIYIGTQKLDFTITGSGYSYIGRIANVPDGNQEWKFTITGNSDANITLESYQTNTLTVLRTD